MCVHLRNTLSKRGTRRESERVKEGEGERVRERVEEREKIQNVSLLWQRKKVLVREKERERGLLGGKEERIR